MGANPLRRPDAATPNFLIIGAARAGTTALYEYLDDHPQVFMPQPKEPHYFSFEGQPVRHSGPGDDLTLDRHVVAELGSYLDLFQGTSQFVARGEGSVSYLYKPESAERIRRRFPDMKLICILRNPADRAYSAYMYMRSRLLEPIEDFREALAAEPARIAAGWQHIWHYRQMGYYGAQIEPYLEQFGRDQMRVYVFEEFRANQRALLEDCSRFLGIDETLVTKRKPSPNVSGVPSSRPWARLILGDNRIKDALRPWVPERLTRGLWRRVVQANLQVQKQDRAVRAELLDGYRADILRLQKLLGRDLGLWLDS